MFRQMRRFRQQAPEEECIRILSEAKRGVLALLGDEGYPYAVPLDFLYEDGKIFFHCAKEGHKADAVRACDKASFCVLSEGVPEPGEWWYHFTSVIAFGRIRMLEEGEEKYSVLRKLGEKYMPDLQTVVSEVKQSGERAQVMVMTIEHMTGKHVREK